MAAHPPELQHHVRAVLPDGQPHTQALSEPAGAILSVDRTLRAAAASQELVLAAVFNATGDSG